MGLWNCSCFKSWPELPWYGSLPSPVSASITRKMSATPVCASALNNSNTLKISNERKAKVTEMTSGNSTNSGWRWCRGKAIKQLDKMIHNISAERIWKKGNMEQKRFAPDCCCSTCRIECGSQLPQACQINFDKKCNKTISRPLESCPVLKKVIQLLHFRQTDFNNLIPSL